MTEVTTQERATAKRRNGAAKRDKVRMVADDVVTANSLATHLGCTRQNIARLVSEAIIEQRSDGCFDQSATRLRYIKHLREHHRHTPRSEADTAHIAVKTQMLQIKLMEKQRELVKREDVNELLDSICGLVLTHLSGLGARCSRDLTVRRTVDAVVYQVRRELAQACEKMADAAGEPPLADQQRQAQETAAADH